MAPLATLSRKGMNVQARAASSTKTLVRKTSPPPATKPTQKSSLSILARVEELRLLSQVEQLGLLSKLEKAGFTLSAIEERGLLSFAEKSGILSLIADTNTPGLLNTTGVTLLGAAAAFVYFLGDDSAVAAVAGAVVLGSAGLAALVAGSTLDKFQKL